MIQLVPLYQHLGQFCENVLHFSTGADADAAVLNNVIDAYVAWENASGKPLRCTNTVLTRVTATSLTTASSAVVDRAINPIIPGTNAGISTPSHVTIACAVRTGLRGRSFRGRIYHIGLTETMRTGDGVTTGALAALVAAYTSLLTLGVAPIAHLGVLSAYSGGVERGTRLFTQATAITIDGFIDSQRRRLPNHNRHH